MKTLFTHIFGRLLVLIRSLGPYAAIELLLPGGSVLALLYWWHRHRVRHVRVISPFGTCLEVQPSGEQLSAPNPVLALGESMSRANAESDVSSPVARCAPRATLRDPFQ